MQCAVASCLSWLRRGVSGQTAHPICEQVVHHDVGVVPQAVGGQEELLAAHPQLLQQWHQKLVLHACVHGTLPRMQAGHDEYLHVL